MSDNLYKGAIGKKITCDCVIDISGASVRTIKYRKPDETEGSFAASEESTTEISYTTTAATEINQTGPWTFQPYVEKGSFKEHGDPAVVEVFDVLTGS